MLIYWSTLTAVVFMEWLSLKAKSKSRASSLVFTAIATVIMILVTGLRVGVGTDYYMYQDIYFWSASGMQGSIEIGYYLLSRLCYAILPNFHFFLLVLSTLYCVITRCAIEKLSPDQVMSVFLLIAAGYFFAYMNMMRQMLAAAILLYSLVYVRDSKLLRFTLCVFLACMIHTTSFVFYFVYFVRKLSNKGIVVFLTLFAICVASGVADALFQNVVGNFSKYEGYYDSAFNNGRVAYVAIAVDLSVLIFAALLSNKFPSSDSIMRTLLVVEVLSLMMALATGFVPLADRLRRYFSISMIVFIPRLLALIEDEKLKFALTWIIVIAFLVYMQITISVLGHYGVLPYACVLD